MAKNPLQLVIKIGTAALSNDAGEPDEKLIGKLINQIALLKQQKHNPILVSSGAVGAGRALNKKHAPLRHCDEVASKQIFAALGQTQLMSMYQAKLAPQSLAAAQILLTKQDFRTRTHHKHIMHLFRALEKQPHIL